jgi:predicted TIM-barrel fold metal-dependent hydrolase
MTQTEAPSTTTSLTRHDLKVVDADTHYSEPHDLWTSRVSGSLKEAVPHVVERDGHVVWLLDGDQVLSSLGGAGSVIRKNGTRQGFWEYDIAATMEIDEVYPASYDVEARLKWMDEIGVWAHVMYPNLAGFGAHKLAKLENQQLARLIVSVYNDAMAELQETSGGRLFPQALVPFWDIDAAVAETERCGRELGLRGITMCSEPHAGGLPDLTAEHWYPLWEVCEDLSLPINFHVGAGEFGMEAFFKGVWPGQNKYSKMVVGAVNIELHNAEVLANLLTSGLLERFPRTKWVSVESGIGWIPCVLERLEYQLLEELPEGVGEVELPKPRELFERQVYACFWYEEAGPSRLLDKIGFDNVLFETDFPHPTCMYESPVEHGLRVLAPWGPDVQRKVMQDNAAALYRIPL